MDKLELYVVCSQCNGDGYFQHPHADGHLVNIPCGT